MYYASAEAVTLEPRLPQSNDEARAVELFKIIRCLSCAGETIYDSRGRMAKDFRSTIRRKIKSGASDDNIRAYFVERYGSSVLVRPTGAEHHILWLAPIFFAGIGLVTLCIWIYRRKA